MMDFEERMAIMVKRLREQAEERRRERRLAFQMIRAGYTKLSARMPLSLDRARVDHACTLLRRIVTDL